MSGRLRRVGIVLLAAAVVAASGLWLARDRPRRLVEQRLAALLQAEVRLGRLALEGSRLVVLEGLEVRRPAALPQLERLSLARVEAHGRLSDIVGGRIGRLRLDGFDAVLSPDPRPPRLARSTFRVDLLEVPAGTVTVRAGGEAARFELLATLRDLGGAVSGEARVSGPRLDTTTLLLLAGRPDHAAMRAEAEQPTASLRLDRDGTLSLALGADRVTLRRHGHSTSLGQARLQATGSLAGDRVRLTAVPELEVFASSRVELTLTRDPLRLERLDARCSELELRPLVELLDPLPGGVTVDGRVTAEGGVSPDGSFHARVTAGRVVLGSAIGTAAARVSVDATMRMVDGTLGGPVTARVELTAAGGGRLDPYLPIRLDATGDLSAGSEPRFEGRLSVDAATVGAVEADGLVDLAEPARLDLSWRVAGVEVARLVELAAAGNAGPLPVGLRGRLEAHGTLFGPPAAPSLVASAIVERLVVTPQPANGWSLQAPRARLDLDWQPTAGLARVTLPATPATLEAPRLGPLDLVAGAEGTVVPSAGTFRLERLEVEAPGLAAARLTASGRRGGPVVSGLQLELPDLERLRSTVRPLVDPLPSSLTLTGGVTADLEVTAGTDRRWAAAGPLRLLHGGFVSDDGSRVVEGLQVDLRVEASGQEGRLQARASGDAGSFQLLWGTLYADGADTRVELDLQLEAVPAERSWRGSGTAVAPGGLRLAAGLERRPGRPLAGWAEVEAADLSAVLDASIRPALAPSAPDLEGLRAGGAVTARVDGLLGTDLSSAQGQLTMTDGSLDAGGFQVRGVDLALPVDITWSRPPGGGELTIGGTPRQGSLRFAGATARGLVLEPAAVRLAVEADRLTLSEPLTLPLLGGDLVLDDVALVDLLRPTRHLATSVELRGFSLEQLSRLFSLPPLEGELGGSFPTVRLTPTTLRVDGTGLLTLFGGTVSVRNISGRDVLGRYPRLLFDAQVAELDLGQLTRAFDFGEVTGVAEGEVTGCELFRGVPLRFSGYLRTVPRPGVKQRISLKAVNNLAILGTGSGLGLLDSGLRRLISSYSYVAFGASMELAQDRFQLRGLERRGDRELFLRGRYPLRLDVVNVAPGSTVSFRTMVARLRDLDFSRAQTQP